MNIAIRVNASNIEGGGHFNRAFFLAKQLKKKKSKIFIFSNNLNKDYLKIIKKNNFQYFFIKKDKTNYEQNDIGETVKIIQFLPYKLDLLILDSYLLGVNWERQLSNYTKKLIVIDDVHRPHFCDLYISPLIKPLKKNILKKKCKILYGLKYLIVKPSFFEKFSLKRKILIYMGEADNKNLTLKILKVLKDNLFDKFKFTFLLGSYNKKKGEIIKEIKKKNNFEFKNFQSSLSNILSQTQIGILSGGSTIFEFLYYKIPVLIICQNNMQYNLIKKNKICQYINVIKSNSLTNIKLKNFFKTRLNIQKLKKYKFPYLDLKGSHRIVKNIYG